MKKQILNTIHLTKIPYIANVNLVLFRTIKSETSGIKSSFIRTWNSSYADACAKVT